jgi:hypothetical protein
VKKTVVIPVNKEAAVELDCAGHLEMTEDRAEQFVGTTEDRAGQFVETTGDRVEQYVETTEDRVVEGTEGRAGQHAETTEDQAEKEEERGAAVSWAVQQEIGSSWGEDQEKHCLSAYSVLDWDSKVEGLFDKDCYSS